MSPQWYWRSQGRQHGPLSTEELGRLVRQHRIADADELRLAENEEWMSAAQVKAMFAGSSESASAGTPSESAARLLSHAAHARLKRRVERASRSAALVDLFRKSGGGLAGIAGNLGDWLAAGVGSLSKLGSLFGRKTTLAAAIVILLAILFKDVDFGNTRHRDVFEQLSTASDQMQSLQRRGASDAEWKEFEQQTLAWLDPTLEALQEAARSKPVNRIYWLRSSREAAETRRQLILAANRLKFILARPRGLDQTLDEAFLLEMSAAHDYLSGKMALQQAAAVPTNADGAATEAAGTDPLLAGMLAVDAVVIGGVAWLWWRRRRRAFG